MIYIWNDEYTVLIADAKTLEEAKSSIRNFREGKEGPLGIGDPVNFEPWMEKVLEKPPIIVHGGEGLIFDHSNY